MDYEKKYNEALERAKKLLDSPRTCFDIEQLKDIFPELAESEDERIRKEIISALKFANDGGVYDKHIAYLEKQKDSVSNAKYIEDVAHAFEDGRKRGIEEKQKEPHYTKRNALFDKCVAECDPAVMKKVSDEVDAMLEKEQKPDDDIHRVPFASLNPPPKIPRQKPAEWSEDIIRKAVKEVGLTQHQIDWFKTNVFPPKQEWSEEDEEMLHETDVAVVGYYRHSPKYFPKDKCEHIRSWLKSLRPQSHIKESENNDTLRYCIEYINPLFPKIDDKLNVRHLRIPDEHGAEMALTIILSFGGKVYALYRGNLIDGKLGEWTTPMIVDTGDWYTEGWLQELEEQKKYNPQSLAIDFINYLDTSRQDRKMCLSNGECIDIETAFAKKDWAKILRYAKKYSGKIDLDAEIKKYTESLYNETFGNGQGTLDEFDWEDISTVIEDTARHFYSLRPSWKPSEEQITNLLRADQE